MHLSGSLPYCPVIGSSDSLTPDLSRHLSEVPVLLKKISYHLDEFQPKIKRKVKALNFDIEKTDRLLKNAKAKIVQLEGGRASRIIIIGALIKLFYLFYNRKPLAQQQAVVDNLDKQKQNYLKKIDVLHRSLSNQDKLVKCKAKQVLEKLDQVSLANSISQEELPLLFEIEYIARDVLARCDFAEKNQLQDCYEQKILPLIRQAKQSITEKSFHFTVKAAGNKGKAVQVCFKALKNLTENQPILKTSVASAHDVFLFPEQGAVFKHSNERAQEEERLVNQLYDLMSKQAVVGTFNIQKASIEKFGIEVSPEIQGRGFTSEELSTTLRTAIKRKLPISDQLILIKHEATPPKNDQNLANYQQMAKQDWVLKVPNEQWKTITLKELRHLYLTNKLPIETQIGPDSQQAVSLAEHIVKETSFFQALNYFPTLKTSPQTLYLIPNLKDSQTKAAYELCEQFKWSYIDGNGSKHEVDFKTLHARYLQKDVMHQISPIPSSTALKQIPTSFERDKALEVQWKAFSPELMRLDSSGNQVTELMDIQVKPFIKHMLLMKDLQSHSLAQEVLLKRLTSDAEFNAVLTGELQLLDAHDKNLGVIPEPNPEYDRFKDIQFSLAPFYSHLNFNELILKHLEGKLLPATLVQFKEGNQTIQKTLQDLPDLQKALNVRWQFVIFDTDLSLSEDNRLQEQFRNGEKGHLIPFRCVLLETKWKDSPLSETTVQRLLESDERDLRVKNWIKKADAPIYRILSETAKIELDKQLSPIFERYTLSEPRRKKEAATVKKLFDEFTKEFSELTDPNYLAIWQILEQDLSSITIRPQDTLEKTARRYHQNVNELKQLNPHLEFKPGNKVKIKYDLTSNTPEARRKRICFAAQLFPRLTKRQQHALIERQTRRKEYLNSYQELSQSTLQKDALITQIQSFLNNSETPLSSIRKEELLKQLIDQKLLFLSNSQKLLTFKQAVCQECQPTYFNLMKAMYPLLADAYALTEAVYGNNQAGKHIGWYANPLEAIITKARAKFPQGSWQRRIADELDQQINTIKDPAFFGHWN